MKTITSALIVVLHFSFALAQDNPYQYEATLDDFLIKGGVVNVVEGKAALLRPEAVPQSVEPKHELQNGDVIQTGENGRLEVLLNPGYYLRIFPNTQVVFLDLAPHNLTLTITRGSAIVEILLIKFQFPSAWEPDPTHSAFYDPITMNFPQSQSSLVAGGVYRFDVSARGETVLKVVQGRAFFAGRRVEKGMKASFQNGAPAFTKFNLDEADVSDNWSQARGQALVKINKDLRNSVWYRTLEKNRRSYIKIGHDRDDPRGRELGTVQALGGVATFVQPGVFLRDETSPWRPLDFETQLQYGELVKTDAKGRVQIAVYPTCWLFLASNTEIVYGVRPDGDAAIKVLRGSAIVIMQYGSKEQDQRPVVTFEAPQAEYEIVKDGTYQLTVNNNNTSEMNIYSGRVRVAGHEIEEERRVVFRGANSEIQRVSKRERDSLYVWSIKRLSAFPTSRRLRIIGVWCLDNATNSYTFVRGGPFLFRSPYGGEYSIALRR